MDNLKCDICCKPIQKTKLSYGVYAKTCENCRTKWRWKYQKDKCQYQLHNWYLKNKQKVIKSNNIYWGKRPEKYRKVRNKIMNRWYHNNRRKFLENMFVYQNRIIFKELLGNTCKVCDSTKVFYHHKTYEQDKLPHSDYFIYSKQLIPLCRECHRKRHKELKTNRF